ncbi:alpha/beta hydrolase [Streptomyces sp. ST1015]|nr:alpha/beta hydrolase [Streptomyces sp. ST1015]
MTARVYGAFDQAQLDAQYSPSSLVGDIQPFLDDYAESSRLARHELASVARRDLRFGPGPDDLLDLYGPSGPGNDTRPALFFVHGGYWQQLSKEDSAFPAPALVEAGAVYATPDYTLAPRARLSDIVDQVRRAFAWLWHRAADHRIDPGRIVVAGSSAGAHLAAMLLTTPWRQWSARRPHRGRRAVRRHLRPGPGATDLCQRRRPHRRRRSPGLQPAVPDRCALPRGDRLGRARDGRVQAAVLCVRGASAPAGVPRHRVRAARTQPLRLTRGTRHALHPGARRDAPVAGPAVHVRHAAHLAQPSVQLRLRVGPQSPRTATPPGPATPAHRLDI